MRPHFAILLCLVLLLCGSAAFAQSLSGISFTPTTVLGGSANSIGTVTLTSNATAPVAVHVTSSNPSALSVPYTTNIGVGYSSKTLTGTSYAVTSVTTVTVTATYNGVSQTATVTVNPVQPSSVSLNPTSVVGNHTSTGTVTITANAPTGGAVVALTSSNTAVATVAASVTVPAGSSSTTFTVSTAGVTSSTTVTITATCGGMSQTATLTVTTPLLSSITATPTNVVGGSTNSSVLVALTDRATVVAVINLTSSNPAALSVPSSVTINPTYTTKTFTATSHAVSAVTTVTLTATYNGVNQTATVTVNPATMYIDAGSSMAYTSMSSGITWAADEDFTGGSVEAPGSPPSITNTADPVLYQTQRVETTAGATFTYTLPVANGTYNLGLLFAEIDGKTQGQRVFNITANGTALLTGFDIYKAAGGPNKAVSKSFLVTVTTGQITLVFTGTTGQAAVSAISVVAPGGGTSATDIPPPGWAEDVIPSDQSDADGDGPSASLSVSLPSGVLENHPGADLDVFNPLGPGVSYSRIYRSALAKSGIFTPGLSPGWRDNYSLSITSLGGGSYTLNYPNGATESWTTTSGIIHPPSGAPYLVALSGGSLTMTFKDYSSYTFTPDPNNANNFLLTGLSNIVGSAVTIARDAANGNRMTALSNSAGPLLTLTYSGATLSSITDVYNRTVTYGFSGGNLATVSQVNAPTAIRWQYGYTTINSQPFLNAVMVPDPSSGGMSEADPQYTPDGHVAQLRDAEGNERTYTYSPRTATVSVYGPDNTLSQTWTQKFDPNNHNVDTGVTDAYGNYTTLAYGDSANPFKVTAASNKNHQTATATFDSYGNTTSATDLRSVQTQNTYDPTFPLGQVLQVQIGANQPTPKTPTNFTYYNGTTQVGGVTQAKGLVTTMSVPTPGTLGTGAQVTSTYTYTAMGNVATVVSPGPVTNGATVTTTYNYTSDPTYGPNGEVGGTFTTTEKLGQPITIADPLGNVTHYRYDLRGNVLTVITPTVVSSPDTSTVRGLRTDYTYDQNDQITQVIYPPTNPNTPTARAYDAYAYEYDGGPLQTVTSYDESGTQVRQSAKGDGKEDEQKSQAGSVQQANFNYDPQYRLKQAIDGNSNPAQTLGYDAVSNLTSQAYALGDGNQFAYDADHNLTGTTDGRSITTTLARAADDSRVTGLSYSDGTPTVNIGTSGYDVYDRVTSWSDGAGSYTATYDDDDNLMSKTTTYTGLPAVTVSYTYNNDGSRATMTTPKSLSGSVYTNWTFTYYYDLDERLIEVDCPWKQLSSGNSLAKLNYYYDAAGRLLKQNTAQGDTFYIYNARGFVVDQQESNTYYSSSFTNLDGNPPPAGTIPNQTVQSVFISGSANHVLLADYLMQYDSLGNRTSMAVNIPPLELYDNTLTAISYKPHAPDVTGTLLYTYDTKDRLTLETTNDTNNNPTFDNSTYYNDNWNYFTGADLADNLTTVRGSSAAANQSFNADDQISTETYDLAGDRTSYTGGTIGYDAEARPISVPGNSGMGTTAFTQLFTGEGNRAWKLPSGGAKTYYLYDGDTTLLELDSSGNPILTYAYGANGLLERYSASSSTLLVYLFDPSGNVVHRVSQQDPNVNSSGGGYFANDTAIYAGQGLLHGDIDPTTGGYNRLNLDAVGYKGQTGSYTDLETLYTASGLYTALTGPGGSIYYDPLTALGLSRSQIEDINTYADNLNPFAGWTFGAYAQTAGQFGVGEIKGFANFGASLLTVGIISHPLAANGAEQSSGAGTADYVATVGSLFTGEGEAVAVERGAAKALAGVESKVAGSPIFADTDLLVAATHGHAGALSEIQNASQVFITPNQYREFLAGGSGRRAFLQQFGIKVYGGSKAGTVASSEAFQEVFSAVKGAHGRGDAALAAFAHATGISAVTMDRRLFNYLTQNSNRALRNIVIPIRRIPY